MPSSTFFRLPEEKRERLMQEVWKEFTRVSYAEASINRIILGARIPRGSFYQYFEDKNDLFLYLLDIIREKFLELLDAVASRVSVPIIASGGAGKKEDFVELFKHKGMDAGLAASIFHTKQVEIADLKRYLRENGVEMRL